MSSPPSRVHLISNCVIKPSPLPHRRYRLTPWDLNMLSLPYIQMGLLFTNHPPSLGVNDIVDRIKTSLSTALLHFYPLAGRLVTEETRDDGDNITGISVAIDCNNEGAEVIHAVADHVTVANVLCPSEDVPSFIRSFFPLDGAVNHDGHSRPLLAIQVTELVDGIFVGCSLNHTVADGTSYWHFLNAWAELARAEGGTILSRPPLHDRWFIDGNDTPPIKLPFSHPDQFIERYIPLPLRQRIFHFSPQSIAKLKAKANQQCNPTAISSFQALSSLVWRSITLARNLPPDQETSCRLTIENRARLNPPLSPDYFGNSFSVTSATTTVGELLAHGLEWTAELVRRAVAGHTDDAIRRAVRAWMAAPAVAKLSRDDRNSVVMVNSPRFDVYGCDFGWGKGVAVRSGGGNNVDGMVTWYPGREGKGSVDLEVCLLPEAMATLLSSEEFMGAVSHSEGS